MARPTRAAAVGLLSAATLAYEILLVRAFAIEQFHHFAYMAIGVAMLGFGASGTLLALRGDLPDDRADRWFAAAAALTAAALLASPLLVHRISLDATQLAVSRAQLPRLAAVYLSAALPFGLGGLAVLLALMVERARPGALYGAGFLGSGVGALAAVGILWLWVPERAVALPAVLAALGAWAALSGRGRQAAALGLALAALTGVVATRPPWHFTVTPYKELPQIEAFPSARRVAERTSPVGWVVAVEAPAFRYAPGLSLAYQGAFPEQTALFVDGQIAGAAPRWGADPAATRVLGWLPTAAPYAIARPERVLVLGAGGGTEAWSAAVHGARDVAAVELQPDLVRLSTDFTAAPEGWSDRPITWVVGDARSYVAHVGERFDLVTLAAGGGPGGAAAGVYALNEDFLHTVDAYRAYLGLLTDGGMLAVTGWLGAPPRQGVRAVLTVAEALRDADPGAPRRGLAVVRSWGTWTVIARPSGFAADDVAALGAWAEARQFDLDWYPGLDAPRSRFNFLDDPALYRAAEAAVAGPDAARRFAAAYPFFVAPVSDARPYPHHFARRRMMAELLTGDRGSWLPFAEWGYLALVATLIQSAAFAALLLLLPAALRARRGRGLGRLLAYFGAIGLAYLSAEIAAIQQLALLLGHPVYAVAVVLTALLVASGLGSMWSDRAPLVRGRHAALALAGAFIVYAAVLLPAAHALQPAPLAVRAAAAFAVLVPPALLMGVPFPIGVRQFADRPGRLAWAWAANGFASVVAAPLAALVAVEWGSRALFLVASGGYLAAAAAGAES